MVVNANISEHVTLQIYYNLHFTTSICFKISISNYLTNRKLLGKKTCNEMTRSHAKCISKFNLNFRYRIWVDFGWFEPPNPRNCSLLNYIVFFLIQCMKILKICILLQIICIFSIFRDSESWNPKCKIFSSQIFEILTHTRGRVVKILLATEAEGRVVNKTQRSGVLIEV